MMATADESPGAAGAKSPAFPYAIPDPVLRSAENLTPFAHFVGQKMGVGRVFSDVIVLKGTFALASGVLRQADEQRAVRLADRYREGRPAELSSLERHGELHLGKPGADLLVTGTAAAPGGRPTARWLCSVAIHDEERAMARLTLEATGPRRYVYRALGGWSLSEPEPTFSVPIRYELAFGGAYPNPHPGEDEPDHIAYEPNPSGCGFLDERSLDRAASYAGPQWQHPEAPLSSPRDRPALAGFGPVARSWASRVKYAGTYDDAWLARTREEAQRGIVPDYAADFDPTFFHCAHPALICPSHLRGDERVGLRGFVAESPELVFQLPRIYPTAEVLPERGGWERLAMRLDTVHVDLDAACVELTWRVVLAPRRAIEFAILSVD